MKKTITLLLAATGAAFAAEPLQLKWENNTASLTTDINGNDITYPSYSWAKNTITVAISLNWQAMMQEEGKGEFYLFQVADNNGQNHGLDIFFGTSKYIDAWTNSKDDYNAFEMKVQEEWTSATKAAIVYTAYATGKSNFTTFNAYLYLWDNEGNMSLKNTINDYSHGTVLETLSSVSYNNTYVDNINVYSDIISSDEAKVMAELVSASIPEPATATLSLLALAGLAARRRRR